VRIYLASTPFHLLVIGALQISTGDAPAVIMYDDEYGFISHLGSINRACPNAEIELLRPFERSNRLSRVIKSRKGAKAILRRVKSSSGKVELFTCTSTRTDFLRVAHLLKESIPVHFVEDGLDAYLPHSSTELYRRGNFLQHYGTRLVNGFPSPDVWDNTTTMEFKRFHVLYPEICRSTIPQDRIECIEPSWFRQSVDRFNDICHDLVTTSSPTDVVFPSLSVHMPDVSFFLESLRQWVATVRSQAPNSICAIKLHPREFDEELMLGIDELDVIRYPSWIPAELLVHYLDPRCRITMGLSTFILSSKILAPERIILLDSSVKREYVRFFRDWDESILAS
jgi:hypothetical protein